MIKSKDYSNMKRLLSMLNSTTFLRTYSSSPIDPHAYTKELYKKNFIKYPVQSKLAVQHDYVFTGDERLPSLEERLKGENLKSNQEILGRKLIYEMFRI